MTKMSFIRKTLFLLKFNSLDVNLNFELNVTQKIIYCISLQYLS